MNIWVAKICQYSSFSLLSKTEPQIQTASTARDTLLTSRILSRTDPPFVIGLHSSSLPYSGRPSVAFFSLGPLSHSLPFPFLPFPSLPFPQTAPSSQSSASVRLLCLSATPRHTTGSVLCFPFQAFHCRIWDLFSCKTAHDL